MERRTLLETVEFRSGDRGAMAAGYALKYGALSQDLGGFVERVMPGSTTKTVQEQDIRALFNHAPDHLLGRKGAGTLRLYQDQVGLRYEVDLPNTTIGRDVAELLARGDIIGSSFGFTVAGKGAQGSTWTRSETGFPVRELRAIAIRDVGPVTFPAYLGADVALRSLAEERSLPFDEVTAAASENRLAELLDEASGTPRPGETHRVIRRRYL